MALQIPHSLRGPRTLHHNEKRKHADQASLKRRAMSGLGPKAALTTPKGEFRFPSRTGLRSDIAACLKNATKRLMHRSKQNLYSITSSARLSNEGSAIT